MRRSGRFVHFAISSPSHYYRLVKMYINTLNIWTTYGKFNSVSNSNNKDVNVQSDLQHTHTHTHAHAHAHTHTLLSDKENEEIEEEA